MTDLQEFENDLRAELVRSAQSFAVPAGAVERAIESARTDAPSSRVPQRRMPPWLLPLAAAAAVATIVAGVTLATSP